MKLARERPYSNPEAAARMLVELAKGIEAVQDGRIHIEKINAPFLFTLRGSGPEFGAGIKHAIDQGWLEPVHESGTFTCLSKYVRKHPLRSLRGRVRTRRTGRS